MIPAAPGATVAPPDADDSAEDGPADSGPSPVIGLRDAVFRWPARGGAPSFELRAPSWRLEAGQRVCVIGASGGGKTTLLNLICGVTRAEAGDVALMGRNLTALSGPARDKLRAEHVGLIFQMFNLLPYGGVLENILLPLSFAPARRARAEARPGGAGGEAMRLLRALGLDAERVAAAPVSALSVGQTQRVAAARALIGAPAVVVADEPTSALDAENRANFLKLLFAEAEATGAALLVVSHDEAVARAFDKVQRLSDIATTRRGGEVDLSGAADPSPAAAR